MKKENSIILLECDKDVTEMINRGKRGFYTIYSKRSGEVKQGG